MWCNHCNLETDQEICPICGQATVEEVPHVIYWCDHCKTPVIETERTDEQHICGLCQNELKYLSADIRPVFPEEKLLLSFLIKSDPEEVLSTPVWAHKNRYFIDGKAKSIPNSIYSKIDHREISEGIKNFSGDYHYDLFDDQIEKFIEVNSRHLLEITLEAEEFIRETAADFPEENLVISFSGGKDSSVVADLVTKALSDPSIVHIFGDTTLEFPTTIEYAKRFRADHPQAIFKTAKNQEQDFMEVCEDIGPPARMMRWCCSMFKTGPITRVINSFYRNQPILTFYGIRKEESVSRSKYNRVEDSADAVKIKQQTVAAPIFSWKDADVWLYLLTNHVDFNKAYTLGFDRVGCWLCPNNSLRAQFFTSVYFPERAEEWRDFLIDFAKKIGKPDPEEYVDSGNWKARQGGNGLAAADDIKIKFSNCTSEEYAKIYRLNRPMDDEFLNMITPFGEVSKTLGQKLLNEVIVLDPRKRIPILSIQPFVQDGYEYAVKVKTLNVADHERLQQMVGYQVRKFNACRKCLKCESLCQAGAITITNDRYYIDPQKCIHCKMCVTAKYLRGGCMMEKYLRIKD